MAQVPGVLPFPAYFPDVKMLQDSVVRLYSPEPGLAKWNQSNTFVGLKEKRNNVESDAGSQCLADGSLQPWQRCVADKIVQRIYPVSKRWREYATTACHQRACPAGSVGFADSAYPVGIPHIGLADSELEETGTTQRFSPVAHVGNTSGWGVYARVLRRGRSHAVRVNLSRNEIVTQQRTAEHFLNPGGSKKL
jgi:hypothetical protein